MEKPMTLPAVRDRLLVRLVKAQAQRSRRRVWALFEQKTMLDAVNEERVARGLAPVALSLIQGVENFACGHVDYSLKFALYCAEIVLEMKVAPNGHPTYYGIVSTRV